VANLGRIIGPAGVGGLLVQSPTGFDHRSGEPLNSIMLISCRSEAGSFRYLFGIAGEHYGTISQLRKGDRIHLEKSAGTFMINSMPAKRLYQRTLDGLVEMAGSGWRKLIGQKPGTEKSPENSSE